MDKQTKQVLEHFGIKSLQNLKDITRFYMNKLKRGMGSSYTTYSTLLDRVVEIILPQEGESYFWGITIPLRIKEVSRETGMCESATKEHLKKLKKLGYIKSILLPYGKRFLVRVFPEKADFVYKEFPAYEKLLKKFADYIKSGQVEQAKQIWELILKELLQKEEPSDQVPKEELSDRDRRTEMEKLLEIIKGKNR